MIGIMQSTTPPIEFTFKQYNVNDITECYLTIKQDGVKIEKNLDEAVKKTNSIVWNLTQEETKVLNPKRTVEIQIKYKLANGVVTASPLYEVNALKILKLDVI